MLSHLAVSSLTRSSLEQKKREVIFVSSTFIMTLKEDNYVPELLLRLYKKVTINKVINVVGD